MAKTDSRTDDHVSLTEIGWNRTAITLTASDIQKVNGTATPVKTDTGWGATQITLTTADIQKQNGFVTSKNGNGWGK